MKAMNSPSQLCCGRANSQNIEKRNNIFKPCQSLSMLQNVFYLPQQISYEIRVRAEARHYNNKHANNRA